MFYTNNVEKLDRAFVKYKRQNFVPENVRDYADFDTPLLIGFGQTISQPTTVRLMLGWLEPETGNTILDIGSGSGWTTALLAYLVGQKGRVYAVERIPELLKFGKNNCLNANVTNVRFFLAGKTYGLSKFAPYDRILVSATAQELPKILLEQLKVGGKLVMPVKNDVLEITKINSTKFDTVTHPGFIFGLLL